MFLLFFAFVILQPFLKCDYFNEVHIPRGGTHTQIPHYPPHTCSQRSSNIHSACVPSTGGVCTPCCICMKQSFRNLHKGGCFSALDLNSYDHRRGLSWLPFESRPLNPDSSLPSFTLVWLTFPHRICHYVK